MKGYMVAMCLSVLTLLQSVTSVLAAPAPASCVIRAASSAAYVVLQNLCLGDVIISFKSQRGNCAGNYPCSVTLRGGEQSLTSVRHSDGTINIRACYVIDWNSGSCSF